MFFEGDHIVPVSSGTVVITVVMVYNGKEYSASVPLTVEMKQEEYLFEIWREGIPNADGSPSRAEYGIETTIPDFSFADVIWSIVATGRGGWVENSIYMVDEYGMEEGETYTVTATYVYNGKTYSTSYVYTYHSS